MKATFKQVVPVLTFEDLDAAMTFYTEKLGFQVSFRSEWNYHGIVRDGLELHMGKGQPNKGSYKGANVYFIVQHVDALREEFIASGAVPADVQVTEQSYGARELHVYDPFGYRLGFSEPK